MTLRRWPGWVLVAASGVFFFSVPVADNDLWGHVYFGREILSSRQLPAVNQYSYTAPSYPWINHEIFAECFFAATYDLFAAPGLLALKVALGLVTLTVMARTIRRRTSNWVASTIALVVAASLMSFGYLVRPQLFTFLALALLWDRLIASLRTGSSRPMFLLPLLFAVWVNTHGGVMAGIGVLLAFSAMRWLSERRADVLLVIASIGSLLLNPYGLELPLFLMRDLARSREISEWAAIPLFDRSNLQFKIAFVVAVAGALRSTRRDLPEILPAILAGFAAFRYERHVPIFALLVAPHLAATLAKAASAVAERARIRELSRSATAALGAGMLGIASLQLLAAVGLCRSLGFQIFVSPEQFPIHAVAFLERQGLRGNLALPFDWGEYAIWHLYPRCRVSIDGRYTTAYPDNVIERAWRFPSGGPGWDDILGDASIALLPRNQPATGLLSANRSWRQIYADPTAVVFVREGSEPQPMPRIDPAIRAEAIFP